MLTRRVVFRFTADSSAEFTRVVEGRFPPPRALGGCRHEDTFITPSLSEAFNSSYWDTEVCATRYARTAYAEGLRALAGLPSNYLSTNVGGVE